MRQQLRTFGARLPREINDSRRVRHARRHVGLESLDTIETADAPTAAISRQQGETR